MCKVAISCAGVFYSYSTAKKISDGEKKRLTGKSPMQRRLVEARNGDGGGIGAEVNGSSGVGTEGGGN